MKSIPFDYERPPADGYVFLDIVDGVEGQSISIGDESTSLRVGGPKPWGGGRIMKRFNVRKSDLIRAVTDYCSSSEAESKP